MSVYKATSSEAAHDTRNTAFTESSCEQKARDKALGTEYSVKERFPPEAIGGVIFRLHQSGRLPLQWRLG